MLFYYCESGTYSYALSSPEVPARYLENDQYGGQYFRNWVTRYYFSARDLSLTLACPSKLWMASSFYLTTRN